VSRRELGRVTLNTPAGVGTSSVHTLPAEPVTKRVLSAVLLLLLAVVFAHGQTARILTVDSTLDAVDAAPGDGVCATSAGACTLRAAIREANRLLGPDTILLPAGTHELTIAGRDEDDSDEGDLDIVDTLTIYGAGAGSTIVQGAAQPSDRVLDVHAGDVKLAGLTIRDGAAFNSNNQRTEGGGIAYRGGVRLTLVDVALRNNFAAQGGGLWSSGGTVIVKDSLFEGNATAEGGVLDHIGGAIYLKSGALAVANSAFRNNSSSAGGAIGNDGSVTLTSVTIRDNRATPFFSPCLGGGLYNRGTLSAERIVLAGNVTGNPSGCGGTGAGIWNGGTATFIKSTISGNSASENGGGIWNTGTFMLSNSTVSSNVGVVAASGGIWNAGSFTSQNATIAGNSGGILNGGSGTITLKNTLLAGNTTGGATDCAGTLNSQGHNLVQNTVGCTISGDLTGNITGQTPNLGPLQDNGGPTETHALLAGSPAIDAGSGDCPPPNSDQRDIPRPLGTACDIGAFELEPPPGFGADLRVTKSDSPEPGMVLKNLTYTLTVTNNGPDVATGVTLTDTLPACLNFVSATPSQGTCSGTNTMTCNYGTVNSGESVTVSIVVTPKQVGSLTNSATVIGDQTDLNNANNTATQDTAITPDAPADFVVNSTADKVDADPGNGVCETAPGNCECTLRAAIQESNVLAGGQAIYIPAGTYTLSGSSSDASEEFAEEGDLDIRDSVTINGAGSASTIIQGGTQPWWVDRILQIHIGAVDISGVTIRYGFARNDNNQHLEGGGIWHFAGPLTLDDVVLNQNRSATGGGIWSAFGGLAISNSTFSDNVASESVVVPAVQEGVGGGLYVGSGNSATVAQSVLSGNSASFGAGVGNDGTVEIVASTVSGNRSSPFFNPCSGGGIYNRGTMTLTISTVSGNRTGNGNCGKGGAAWNTGTLTFLNSTVTANSASSIGFDDGGGVHAGGGTVNLKNTILAGNTDNGGQSPDCSGALNSQGHNLIQNTAGCTISGDPTGNIIGQNPNLGPLQDNGGPTLTHALLASSPAIDAASNDCPPPDIDQRGVARPQGSACDIGAFELEEAVGQLPGPPNDPANAHIPDLPFDEPPDSDIGVRLLGAVVVEGHERILQERGPPPQRSRI